MPDSHRIAELFLSTLTTRERAATIVGDLAESAAANGNPFWPGVCSAAASLALRPAAVILAGIAFEFLIAYSFGSSMNAHHSYSQSNWPRVPAMILGFSAMLVSVVAIFSTAFHGFRDTLSRLALALTFIGWIGGTLHFIPAVLFSALAAFTAVLVSAALSERFRPALGTIIITLFVSSAVFIAIVFLNNGRNDAAHVLIPFPLNYAILLLVQLCVSTFLRRRLAVQ